MIFLLLCSILVLLLFLFYLKKENSMMSNSRVASAAILETVKDKKIKNVSIYCAHHFSENLIYTLRSDSINVDNIIDGRATCGSFDFLGIKVKSPSLLETLDTDVTIVIANFRRVREIKETIEYFLSKNPNKIRVTLIDYEGNVTYTPIERTNTITIKISERIKQGTKEYKSIFMDKPWSLNNFARLYFNTRGYKRDNPEIEDGVILNLESFELLKFHKAEVYTHGGVFVNKKLQKESLHFYYVDSALSLIEDNYLYNRYTMRQLFINLANYFYYWKLRDKRKIVFCAPWVHNKNFGHFIVESFPLLFNTLKKLKEDGHDDFCVICPTKDKNLYHSYINPILECMGVDESKRIYPNFGFDDENDNRFFVKKFFTEKHFFNFKNVLLPTPIANNPAYSIPAFEYLKNYFYDDNFPLNYEKIYLRRRRVIRRKLVNEQELENLLESKYGFKSLSIEDYSLKDAINIIMRAKVVVAPEGGVNANMIFLQESAKMISLRAKDWAEFGIFYSSMIGYEQLFIVCDVANKIEMGNELNQGYWFASDIYIDLDYFEKKMFEYEVFPEDH